MINASLAGVPIKGCPFKAKTFDPRKVKVSKMPMGIVGVPCKFNGKSKKEQDLSEKRKAVVSFMILGMVLI